MSELRDYGRQAVPNSVCSRLPEFRWLLAHRDPVVGVFLTLGVKFTVVSDPPEDEQDMECEDVGFAHIGLQEILQSGKDIINRSIEIYDAQTGGQVIGKMTVTVEAAVALQSILLK
ncbi:fantom isoform X4 [Pelobates cultripes]|uniref:Fantom isoform X4 n=1 Tax=Pelobates cultripes TaxID=61616 RepID=A0AAD1REI9_PELCU|nr:fantom isoform X4 [Pelobates cultripes]